VLFTTGARQTYAPTETVGRLVPLATEIVALPTVRLPEPVVVAGVYA
jgi:hypothetical protein